MPKENKKIARTATEAIKLLWSVGFLDNWKKVVQFHERLGKDGYHFTSGEIGMALKRAKYLTRRGARGTFEYIQKHPYIDDEK